MAKISGILTDGTGQIINDCTIELYAKKTTINVLTQTQAFTVASDGRYSMNVSPCEYDVSLIINGFPKKRLGTIHVYSDSVDGSLNDFLINLKENELTPDFLKQVFDARDAAKKSATQAANSATAAKTSEINAQSSADTAKLNATNASVSASSASKSAATATEASTKANTAATNSKACADNANKLATEASQSAKQASDSETAAKTSETNANNAAKNAKTSENNAKKWASTIDTSTLVKKTGDTMSGQLILSKNGLKINYDNKNIMALITADDNYSHVFYDAEKKQWLSKLVYNSTINSWSFQYINDVVINGKSVLKTGDYGIGSLTGAQLNNPDETLNGGFYATRTTKFPELTEFKNRDDSASLIVFPATTKNWCVEMLAVVQNILPRIFFRCATINGKQQLHEVVTTANINNYIPVGVPLPYPTNKPPAGWFECNGSTFDKSKFPKLANAYPSGYLPDLRGVFIRGLDTGSGLDPNRGILSYQGDAIRNIWGEISPISESFAADPIASGAFRYFEKHADHTPSHIDVGSVGGVTFDASRVVPTANENRPSNVAFMYIVKAE